MNQQISISSIFLGLLIYSTYAEEVLIQIVVKKPINIVSDRYVSFSIDPGHLLDLCLRPSNLEHATIMAQNVGPAYFKINGGTSNQFTLDDKTIPFEENQVRILPSDWQALHQWISRTNLKPVISLPYSSKQWSPRSIISILGISNRLGVRNCIWKLGSELNSTETIDYVDDLSAFKTIIDVFRQNGSDWGVVGADVSSRSRADEVDLYAELSTHLSEANGWTEPMEYNSNEQDGNRLFDRDPALRNLMRSKVPVWLNVPHLSSQPSKNEYCGIECELHGVRWANILGSSAQNGFQVVFQRVDKNEVINPSLSYYVSLLHKKLMGELVFDTKILNGDSQSPKFFTHCTKSMSGSFSVMGVNPGDYKSKISTKLPHKYTGSEIYQYVLNVDDGYVLFNGMPVNISSDFRPIVKVKKQNRLTTFNLPPRSVGFWVFPLANLKQCFTKFDAANGSPVKENTHIDLENSSRTASEKLLHELISEIVQIDGTSNDVKRTKRHAIVKKDSKHMNRNKRSADPKVKTRRAVTLLKKFNDKVKKQDVSVFGRPRRRVTRQINSINYNNKNNRFGNLFKTFELPQTKKFEMGKFWKFSPPTQNIVTQNRAAIPPVTSTIHDVYRVHPSEQIFKSVENSELPTGNVYFQVGEERNMDYVEFEDKSDKLENRGQQNRQQLENDKFVEFEVDDAQNVPDHMYEFYNDGREANDMKQTAADTPPYSELWESDVYQKAPPPQTADQHDHYVQEESNNHQQNIDLIVKELPPTFRQNQENLMKAKSKLSAIYMNDGDRISTMDMHLPARRLDMDDDGFFVSKRKRRSIDAHLNDEIENKLNNLKKASVHSNGEEVDDYVDFLNRNGGKTKLLEKITRIIESLEKIDDIGKYNNIEKLNAEIKELENFLFKRNPRFRKNKVTQKDIRRKCKILSVNLEQQCLKENDFYPTRLISRDTQHNSDLKAKKVPTLKNAFPAKKSDSLNRIRRSTMYETSSWEADDRINMIDREMYSANEFNDYVPSVSFKKQVSLGNQPSEENREYIERIEVLQNLPDSFSQNSVMQIAPEQPVPTFTVTDANIEGRVIDKDIDGNEEATQYQTPRFMKKISQSVQDWMDVVERQVSGWWHILS